MPPPGADATLLPPGTYPRGTYDEIYGVIGYGPVFNLIVADL
jgi:hypothetical protein